MAMDTQDGLGQPQAPTSCSLGNMIPGASGWWRDQSRGYWLASSEAKLTPLDVRDPHRKPRADGMSS